MLMLILWFYTPRNIRGINQCFGGPTADIFIMEVPEDKHLKPS
jgi:hypothetical protein